jgi:hypothetical protein
VRAFALAFPPSFPSACAAGFFFVMAHIMPNARLDVKKNQRAVPRLFLSTNPSKSRTSKRNGPPSQS